MFFKPDDFLSEIETFLNFSFDDNTKKTLIDTELKLPQKENKYSHRRSGKSGKYMEKLKPETVNKLNQMFHRTLKKLGWKYE